MPRSALGITARASISNFGNMIGFGIICLLLGLHCTRAGVVYKSGKENARRLIEETGSRTIVYATDEALDWSIHECAEKAMKEISKYSCITFADEKVLPHANETKIFLRILWSDNPDECTSNLVSFPTNAINVTLGSACGTQDRHCTRALLNGLGMAMEHERPDRYQFINIDRSNVQKDATSLFERLLPLESVELVTKYDLSSIMHFGAQEYAKSPDMPVITTNNHLLDDSLGGDIRGRRHLLSHRDKQTINRLFQCPTRKHQSEKETICLRNGYVGENGDCVCPHGFSGAKCEILSYSSRFNVPTCGILTERQGEVTSPNYPERYSRGVFCQWLIEGKAAGDRILFRVNDLDLEHEHLMPGDRCADKLTIWPHGTDVVTKSISCLPDEATRFKGKWYSSQYNWLLIEFRSDPWGQYSHAGFNVSYKIIDPPTAPPPRKPLSRDEEWRRKLSEKWRQAGNQKGAVLDFGGEGGTRMTAASVKTRLLNTIGRQGQLFCYRCDNETHCREFVLQRRACPKGQACAYQTSEHGSIAWRGCVSVDTCAETLVSQECAEIETDAPDHCYQCCVTNLCNMALSEYLHSHAGRASIAYQLILMLVAYLLHSLTSPISTML